VLVRLGLIGLVVVLVATILTPGKYLPWHTTGITGAEETLFAANFPDIAGKMQPISQWRGKILVVNFWATWCPPCREELPELNALQKKYASQGVIILGIATDDMEKTRDFVNETKIAYPILVGDAAALDASTSLGNNRGILPYTVIINQQGKMVSNIFGRIDKEALELMLQALL
jgi:thiol-disulfide isomerase/thioredoxin